MGLTVASSTVEPAALCASIAGQSHVNKGKVNQDGAGVWAYDPAEPTAPSAVGSAASWPMKSEWMESLLSAAAASPSRFTALTVSDGHGSERYDRSDRGSAIAVWLGLQLAAVAAARLADTSLNRKDWIEVELPRRLVAQWRRFVLEDAAPDQEQGDPELTIRRYGATSLGVVVTASGAAMWQLGDGEISVVRSGRATERPVAETVVMLGTETNSLCMETAVSDCRAVGLFGRDFSDAEIVLSTDGLPNSYMSLDDYDSFLIAALDRRAVLGADFRSHLIRWMGRASSHSGDDVSVAFSGALTWSND